MQPAADIESRSDGKIEKLLTEDNEHVAEGQALAVIENPADYEDVKLLKTQLQNFSLQSGRLPELKLQINGKADLGMVQPDYAAFYKNYRDYKEFLQLDYHQKEN
jgi:multidrug efflux pump subunit AcrA (membrane-fusion protein)